MKLVHWFFSSWNLICPWSLLRADCCLRNLLHVGFSFRKACTSIFLPKKQILFMELVVCLFLFAKLAASWLLLVKLFASCFFSSWNLCIYLFLLVKLIFFPELFACWFLFLEVVASRCLFMKHVICWFFSPLNLYNYFSHRKTGFFHGICYVMIVVRKTYCILILLLVKLVH